MAHSLTPAAASATTPFSSASKGKNIIFPSLMFLRVWPSQQAQTASPNDNHNNIINRRTLSLGLAGAVLTLNGGDRSAKAAGRRPPPPPPEEKKDPNLSGVQAKVLASKKRKEAMKEEIAKLRQKGKAIKKPAVEEAPAPSPSPSPSE
ncbi:hypothetical protein TIFTF001_005819 [Ficus carica]|uniref:Uncharacterized protein n=1 Tax=Ficus carica TaxID=3494 RepID=A0AA88A2K9_FICCA|nr:hypothetical protein TIFTF001_005819 [Ficus carica]